MPQFLSTISTLSAPEDAAMRHQLGVGLDEDLDTRKKSVCRYGMIINDDELRLLQL